MKKIIVLGILLFSISIMSVVYYVFNEMNKEDRQGEFYDLYDKIDKNDNYFVIINEKEAFFAKLFGEHFFVEESNCYKRIEDFRNNNIKIYRFFPTETYVNFTIEDAKKIKKLRTTELFFSN